MVHFAPSALWRIVAVPLLGLFLFSLAFPVHAARLYFEPSDVRYGQGDTFIVSLRLDNEGECVNTVGVSIRYDVTALDALDYSNGASLISLWVIKPTIDRNRGIIELAGGIPGGYCGRVVGDPGMSNIITELIFNAKRQTTVGVQSATSTQIVITPQSKVLLNDGRGTPASLTVEPVLVQIDKPGPVTVNEWASVIQGDSIPPETFSIKFITDDSLAEGRHVILFSTSDKQSGISHYEVFETDPHNGGYEVSGEPSLWRRSPSPYILRDQTLKSKILVKAVDKAGNERLAEYLPDGIRPVENENNYLVEYVATAAIVIMILLMLTWKYISLRRQRAEEAYDVVYEDDVIHDPNTRHSHASDPEDDSDYL